MEVTGQLKLKYDTQKVSDKFQKRDFVLATDLSTPYPQFVSFQVTQDKCTMLDNFNQGDEIRVTGKNIDDLQAIMKHLKSLDFKAPLVFDNFK